MLSKMLRRARENCGVSQKYVALTLGVSAPTVSEWESGKKNPTVKNLIELANVYNVSVDALLGRCPLPSVEPMEKMELKDKIKYLREKNGLTLEQVGNAVGVGKSTVRKWEAGDIANIRRDKIERLAAALHITPADLMGWTNPISQESLRIAAAFEKASDREKDLVRIALEPYMRSPSTRDEQAM